MLGSKERYDLILSLGGNCAAAHNLIIRNLRFTSLPFDWLYMDTPYPLSAINSCFKEDFKNFLLKENLVEMQKDPNSSHLSTVHYLDKYTEYRWVNHFYKKIDEDNEYERVKQKFNKRIERLYQLFHQSKAVLFILNTSFEVDINLIKNLQENLKEKFPQTKFTFRILQFNSEENSISTQEAIIVQKIQEPISKLDFEKTTPAWDFLDAIDLTFQIKMNYFYIPKIRKIFVNLRAGFIFSKNKRKAFRESIKLSSK